MALSWLKVETLLINGKDLTNNVEAMLVTHLKEMMLKELKLLAKNLNIKLTGSSKKVEVIDRIFLWYGLERFTGMEILKVMMQLA